MPNWVLTMVTFSGDKADIERVFDEIGNYSSDNGDQQIFDFNKLIPIPEDLADIEYNDESLLAFNYYIAKKFNRLPADSEYCKTQQVIDEVEKDVNISCQKMMELGKKIAHNVDVYQAKDWYDWQLKNWGTKWNACECYCDDNGLFFYTAWSWPKPVMMKLAEICSKYNVEFEGKWADEDVGNNTGYFYCNGEDDVLNYDWYDDDSTNAFVAYLECWGDTNCIGVDSNGEYYRYECGEKCPNYEECGI